MDWLVVSSFFIAVYVISTVWRKWAFSRNNYPETSIKWHVPRFIYITFVLGITTIPLIGWLWGHAGAKIYGQFIFPELAFIAYMFWLLCSEKHEKSK